MAGLSVAEMMALREREARMLFTEWHVAGDNDEPRDYAPLARTCSECGAEEGRDDHSGACNAFVWDALFFLYGGSWDDETDMRERGR